MNTIRYLLIMLATALVLSCTTESVAPVLTQEVMEAALYGQIGTIEKALDSDYNPNQRDPENRTALMYAAFNGHADIAQKLIAAGADVNLQDKIGYTALMYAASGTNTTTVKLLLDNGAKINTTDNNEHFTALMWAAAEGQTENVKLLLRHNADAALQDVDGDTAESFAAKAGHMAVVKAIQEAAPKK